MGAIYFPPPQKKAAIHFCLLRSRTFGAPVLESQKMYPLLMYVALDFSLQVLYIKYLIQRWNNLAKVYLLSWPAGRLNLGNNSKDFLKISPDLTETELQIRPGQRIMNLTVAKIFFSLLPRVARCFKLKNAKLCLKKKKLF